MEISTAGLSLHQRYKLLTGLIVPRPIAWVSSVSPLGVDNLAPFSYFSIASHDPRAISVSVNGRKPGGSLKDTAVNLMPVAKGGTGEFVVNVVDNSHAQVMAMSSRPVNEQLSEFDLCALERAPSCRVLPPRVKAAPAAFECRTIDVVSVGSAFIFIGEVLHVYLEDQVADARGHIDFGRLAPIGRLAGSAYTRVTDRFHLPDEGYFPSSDKGPVT